MAKEPIDRFHVQRRSDRAREWKNMTPETGVNLRQAIKLHNEFKEKHEGGRHNAKFRVAPVDPDVVREYEHVHDVKRGRKAVNDT